MVEFKVANVCTGAVLESKEEAIRRVAALLEKNGCVTARYAESMLKREALANTYLGEGIAIPHGVPADREEIQKTGIAVLQVPQGVNWQNGGTVRLIVGIAARSDEHLELLGRITELLSQPQLTEQLATTMDPGEIVAALTATGSGEAQSDEALPEGAPRGGSDDRRIVTDAGHHFARLAVVPFVAHDAAHRRGGAGHEGAVAYGGHGGIVLVTGIGEHCTFGQQPFETGVVVGAEAGQIVVAELVHYDGQHQLRFLRCGAIQTGRGQHAQ